MDGSCRPIWNCPNWPRCNKPAMAPIMKYRQSDGTILDLRELGVLLVEFRKENFPYFIWE